MTATSNYNSCPTQETLSDFLLGKLNGDELEDVGSHLVDCLQCLEAVQSLESQTDGLVESLRETLEEDVQPQKPLSGKSSKVAHQHNSVASGQIVADKVEKPFERLGTYDLLEVIGRGGTGVVYRARHTRLKTIVAVKVLPAESLTRPDTLARFNREMAAIGQLVHPHIVQATDADEDDGQHFLVMEYVQGGDLCTLVRRQGPLSVAEATSCVLQTAKGLAYAHSQGMIHRDVKPSNILLSSNGVIKVSDLGLARALQSMEDDGSTHTGSLMGTFDFMAPEQALNAKAADERADIYGLGCTLFYLLTGNAPFASESMLETLIAHREQSPPAIRQLRAEVPKSLDLLIRRMLAKNTKDRPASMNEIVTELETLREKAVVEKMDDLTSLFTSERREVFLPIKKINSRHWLRRHKTSSLWFAAMAGAIAGALLVGTGFAMWLKTSNTALPLTTSAARFDVRLVRAADGVSIRHIPDAILLLNGKLPHQSVSSGRFRFLDFIDPVSNSGGFYDTDLVFPSLEVVNDAENANHFALSANATVSIPRSGTWTFCVISDDGFQLTINGNIVGEHVPSRTQAATFIPIELTTGPCDVELIYFEAAGGADLEFCVAEGRHDDFDAKAFQLVGASYEGGLQLIRAE